VRSRSSPRRLDFGDVDFLHLRHRSEIARLIPAAAAQGWAGRRPGLLSRRDRGHDPRGAAQRPHRGNEMELGTRLHRIAAVALAIALGVLTTVHASHADASNVQLTGTSSYSYGAGTAVLRVSRIDDFDPPGTFSATLRLELWAFPTPYNGAPQTGYKLAQYTVGQTQGTYFYSNLTSGNVPFVAPPNGDWVFTLFLSEDVGATTNDGFASIDYHTFTKTETFGAPPPPSIVTAIEYYHAAFGHYFITSLPDEIAKLDNGTFVGWARTGPSFKVWADAADGLSPVCRFFSTSFAPKSSHFYTPYPSECSLVKQNPDWLFEGVIAYAALPTESGQCLLGVPLYRLYNNGEGGAPNHRYTTNITIRQTMINQGWIPEGAGSLAVIACVPA